MLNAVVDVPAGTLMAEALRQSAIRLMTLKKDEINPGLDGLVPVPMLPAPVFGDPPAPPGWLPDRVAAGWPFVAEPVTQPATASTRITTPVTLSRISIDLQRRPKMLPLMALPRY